MILVGQYDSPYVRRVAIALHLLGLPFERNTISVFRDAEAMRRINPIGRIPSLVLDDGEVIIDSAAILDHIDQYVGPDRALVPARGADRRRVLRIIALASGVLDKVGAVVYERTLRPIEKIHEPWIERCRMQYFGGLTALEAATGDGWYAADRLTMAEITVVCMVDYIAMRVPEAMPRGAYPRLEHLAASSANAPAFRDTAPAADEQMPGAPL
jgi:glutathione S-transferase